MYFWLYRNYVCFSAGESFYNLSTAQDLRTKLAKVHEQIDFHRYMGLFTYWLSQIYYLQLIFSKRILTLGTDINGTSQSDNTNTGPSRRQLLLQRNIRVMAVAYLQDVALSMPNIPTQVGIVRLNDVTCPVHYETFSGGIRENSSKCERRDS